MYIDNLSSWQKLVCCTAGGLYSWRSLQLAFGPLHSWQSACQVGSNWDLIGHPCGLQGEVNNTTLHSTLWAYGAACMSQSMTKAALEGMVSNTSHSGAKLALWLLDIDNTCCLMLAGRTV